MKLELTFTPEGLQARTCEGRVEYTLRPRAAKITSVRLDAVDMRILGVQLPGEATPLTFAYDDHQLVVTLPGPISRDHTFRLAVKYALADPPKGMYFVLPNASRPKRPLMVYTMSEPLEGRYWFPTHDWPNARWTSDILVTAPAGYTVVTNGVLQDKRPAADGKSVTFHWHSDVPTDPHLVGLVLGELVEFRDSWRGKPVLVYTQPGSEAAAKYTYRRVPEVLEFYTQLTGIDFPYPGYSHITVVDHHHGGMEHAGFSFVDRRFLAAGDDDEWPLEYTESIFLSHMLAHQWFGGIVNYRSVSQAWLNEGFAILLDSLWTSHTDSPHRFACKMWETAQRIAAFDSSETGKPLVVRDLAEMEDIYRMDGSKIYYKGAWVLEMLRRQLGEEVFWRGVATYLREHRGKAVETSDLRRALEEVSGQDLEQFFQQWVYGHGVPRLEVEYAWDATRKQARITLRQTQKTDKVTPAFAFPLDFCFRVGGEDKPMTVAVNEAHQEWTFDLASEPQLFCVDPTGALLKTLSVKAPLALLRRQALDGPTALARLNAAEQLAKRTGSEAIRTLEEVLRKATEFWMVRQAAAEGLGKLQTEAALQALLRAEKDTSTHPRALAALLDALGRYPVSPEAHAAVLRYAGPEQRLYVQMAAVSALGKLRANTELTEQSVKALQAAARKPTRRAVRNVSLQAMATLEDPRPFETVLELAQPGGNDELRNRAITVLGQLGRQESLRERTRKVLTAWLDDPDQMAQVAAVEGLESLADPRAIADLQRIQKSARKESLRKAAQRAIEASSRPKDPKQSTAALLERVRAIEKQNQELEKRLKEISDKLDALKKPAEGKANQ
jgi:aminopeptidase N